MSNATAGSRDRSRSCASAPPKGQPSAAERELGTDGAHRRRDRDRRLAHRRHRLATGAGIRLSTPQGVSELIVRGLLETEGLAAAVGGQLAVMDLPAAQLLLGKEDRVDQVDVVLRDGADVNAVRRRLEDALPHVLTVAPPAQRAAQYDAVLASFQSMLSGIQHALSRGG